VFNQKMKKPFLEVIQGIDTLSVIGDTSEVATVIFHGYGANMRDLHPLWEHWHTEGMNWYFPNGVLPLSMGAGYEGRSWFSIDIEGLERAMREGRHRDLKDYIPAEFDSTLAHIETYLSDLQKRHPRLIVGGFSQGAMLATHVALRDKVSIEALVILSGNLVAESKMPASAKGIPFYQSHGTSDPVLSYEGARELEKKLQQLGLQGKLETFSGGHEIPMNVIGGVKSFLKGI
jgi:phospholipase/carboxylesterase